MDDATGEDVKISDTTLAPRVTVKLYIPFKISRASIQLNIGNWMADHEEYLSKDVDISDYEPGIHEIGIFIEDIINHYKERGYSPWSTTDQLSRTLEVLERYLGSWKRLWIV